MELGKIKSKIDKLSKEKNIDVQVAWDQFFFDESIYRLSQSKYKNSFVFKGGFYLQNMLGVENRSTMDIDLRYSGDNTEQSKLM